MKKMITFRAERGAPLVRRLTGRRPVALTWVVLLLVASACSVSSAGTGPSVDPAAADLTLVSRDLAFDQRTITVTAGSAWSLKLVNEDAAPHNVAIYSDASMAESMFVGELISSATIVYRMPGLEPGTYVFRCDLHPEMHGTLEAHG
ncbi:MAG TPA: cupredoxin domain-containing protein [Candidatus Limnocylindrales bacterium]|nr:cupredoxin domain-containing protein [Candidatus Limnocylindrales bacterium]